MERIIGTDTFIGDDKAREVVEYLYDNREDFELEDAVLYYKFPAIGDYEDEVTRPFIVVLSYRHGVVIIGNVFETIISEKFINDEDERISHYYGLVEGLLKKSKVLKSKRQLSIDINSVIYVSSPRNIDITNKGYESEISVSLSGLKDIFGLFTLKESLSEEIFLEARSILEGAKALGKKKGREVAPEFAATKLSALAELEKEISNFDFHQRKAAITLLKGPQRIRGLAGSGKTIVLAMKVAQIHIDDPEKLILFTFYTKSLYDLIKMYISKFCEHYNSVAPNWNKIHIMHAWGGSIVEGVYYNTAIEHGVSPIPLKEAKKISSLKPFDFVCRDLQKEQKINPKYDVIIVDEAQDFPQSFFRLCFKLAKGERDDKTIIWAYDELQSIIDVKQKTAVDFFGIDKKGDALIDLERASEHQRLPQYMSNDTVLKKCYRTPLEILIAAHALGFGIYDTIVQMLESEEHWNDVGYNVVQGRCQAGSSVSIERPETNSPLSIKNYEGSGDLIDTYVASDFDDEIEWVSNGILGFIKEGLSPEDILVISIDDRNARTYFSLISEQLNSSEISVNNILTNPYSSTVFTVKNNVTMSTVYRAKGNEAPVVFVLGIDSINSNTKKTRSPRNRLFTAFTRSKAWLRISGIGENARSLLGEVETALKNSPHLIFEYPDPADINIIQHDLSEKRKQINKAKDKFIEELKSVGLNEDEIADQLQGLSDL
ncbi:MAG: DEAD/DEAH box helicase [Desulfovibrio sp.]|uniref:DEAD/DEAH box helicase n=1 Tax=Desulfovibrio sp. 7SRBS1 TaxID=3378064 RepID=UPI003B415637